MPYKDGVGATLNRIGGEAAYRFRGGPQGNRPYRGRKEDLWWVTDGAVEKLTVWSDIANAWVSGGLADGDYGDITVSGGGTVMTIDNEVVTLAKMADLANHGSIPYQGASSWAELVPGTVTQLLSTRGVGVNPQWRSLPSPLTDGVEPIPAFIFASGDVIMVEGGV